jgi:CheY-like chemotaxis protein
MKYNGGLMENGKTATNVQSLRIFVVENHADTLLSLRLYLEDLGHTVSGARNLKEALQLLPGDVQVLISDIGLPDGTGWDLMKQARLPDTVFCIAMSGFGMNADSERSVRAGFRHHLLKPFKAEELDKALAEAAELIT